jgi:pimeloyl-ACP methyl ester carboxylesterase
MQRTIMEAAAEPTLNYVTAPGRAAGAADPSHRMAWWNWAAPDDDAAGHVIVCVHGLSRQGRDFDVLARRLSRRARVVCPDVVGRGKSDWLADPAAYQVPQYVADMLALLAHLHEQRPIRRLDWVGTSMGGLIGMVLCGTPGLPLPVPVKRLVLNDVGPAIEWAALQRIGTYLGRPARWDSPQAAAEAMRRVSAGFGPHTEEQWMALSLPMLRAHAEGGFGLHYDPAIALPFGAMTSESVAAGQSALWQAYDSIRADTLVLRGAESDLLASETAEAMAARGPRARLHTVAGVGHAPTLVAEDQAAVVARFLLDATA